MVMNVLFVLLFNFSFITLFFSIGETLIEDHSSVKKAMSTLACIFVCLSFACFLCIGSLLILTNF